MKKEKGTKNNGLYKKTTKRICSQSRKPINSLGLTNTEEMTVINRNSMYLQKGIESASK